jgi:hypothetical protein
MSDPNTEPVKSDGPPSYPAGTVGMLMRDRDQARANANAAREQADRFTQMAVDTDARAESLQLAIDSLGGNPTP